MKIVALSDLHGDIARLPEIADDLASADVVLLTGDLTHFGHRTAAEQILAAVESYNPHVLAVAGNCDQNDVGELLTERGINLHGRSITFRGMTYLGVGGSLSCPGGTPNELSEEEIGESLYQASRALIPGKPFILVLHQPPLNTQVDRIGKGHHVGSRSIRDFICEWRPLVALSGHIHESRGIDTLDATTLVNPGPLAYGGHVFLELQNGSIASIEIRGRGTAS